MSPAIAPGVAIQVSTQCTGRACVPDCMCWTHARVGMSMVCHTAGLDTHACQHSQARIFGGRDTRQEDVESLSTLRLEGSPSQSRISIQRIQKFSHGSLLET